VARPSKRRQVDVWMNGELVGHWAIAAHGRHEFAYTPTWLDSPSVRPLSLSMPLRPADVPYRGETVEAYFENLLPDSVDIRRRLQSRFRTASTAAFDLLAEIGRDCVGAVQLTRAGEAPPDVQRIEGEPISDAAIAELLRATVSGQPLGQRDDEAFRISIAGAQEKTALLWYAGQWHWPHGATPTTHILKLPLGRVGNAQVDLSTSVENEWLCLRLLRAFGLAAAHAEIAQFEDQKVLVVERFDRRLADDGAWWLRLPQEDMCQATATPPGQKYESDGGPGIRPIMEILLGARDAQADRRTFFKAQLLNWMLCAPDGHAKNFSVFIEAGGRYSLTPLYDVISAYPVSGRGARQLAPEKINMAMAVTGKNRHYAWTRILKRHWLATAHACDLSADDAESTIAELIERTPHALAEVRAALPMEFPAQVAEPIFEGITAAIGRLGQADA